MKTLYLASDHAGFSIKERLLSFLEENSSGNIQDLGPRSEDRVDYPDFADRVCQKLKEDKEALGILICGSGQGMAMRANKYKHIRAALCWSAESAQLAREHNNANVLCVGARLLEEPLILSILKTFLDTPFEGGRHEARVQKIEAPTS